MVAGQLCGIGESEELVALVPERLLDLTRRPLERAGPGLIAEGLTEFLGLGEDFGDCLVKRAALCTQKNTPPKESYALRGVFCAWGIMRSASRRSQGVNAWLHSAIMHKRNPIKGTNGRSAACTRLYVPRL